MEKKKGGDLYPAMLNVSPIRNEQGDITHYISVHEDLSNMQELEAKFQQAQKMEAIGTLVGGIAHDFNNMLAAIQGNLYLAKQLAGGASPMLEKLSNIDQLSGHAADMIRQLLAFARKGIVAMQPISLNGFIKEAFKLGSRSIPESIESRCDVCSEELVVNADPTQLQQVLMNLLNNAGTAVAKTETPRISCTLDVLTADPAFLQHHPELKGERFAHLCIRDNGPGIPDGIKEKIFEPFFTTKPVGEGSGLGLSMVYGAVQTHAGNIEVESMPGAGTAFHIYLPLLSVQPSSQDAAPDMLMQGKGERILLADDEPELMDITREVLESLNYRVATAENGRQALDMFRQSPDSFDIIVTDLVMPLMSGDAMAREVRQLNSAIPVIFCSGYDKEQTFKPGEALSGSLFLHKPFTIEELSQALRAMLKA